MDELIRAFIAIELNTEVKNVIAEIEKNLKLSGADVKWVKPDIAHITLKFLGEINQTQIITIKEIMSEITADCPCFKLGVCDLGVFPAIKSARIIWIGIKEGEEEILKLATILEEKLSVAGFPKENRPFSAHITIGRVKSPINRSDLASRIQQMQNIPKILSSVTNIILFKSILTPSGSIYEPLYTANLRIN